MTYLNRFYLVATMALAVPVDGAQEESRPRLLLLLTIDQGRGDYLERFAPALEGGLARLAREGVVFTDAHHAHAYTVTAAGHAALSTGRHPSHSGMVANNFYDRTLDRWVYCLEDYGSAVLPPEDAPQSSAGRSPKQLLTTGIGDWIQSASPESMVYSVGGKDRAAILMGGQNADGAYWYDARAGHWVTSQHYRKEYPDWVQRFHRERRVDAYFGQMWIPLPMSNELLVKMNIELADGPFARTIGNASVYRTSAY